MEEIRAGLQSEASLSRVMESLLSLVRPAILVRVTEQPVDGRAPPGGSKLGGLPDLPNGEAWPQATLDIPTPTPELITAAPQIHIVLPPPQNTLSLPFIAQIHLEEVAPLLPTTPLPPQGLLSFFYSDASFASDGAIGAGSGAQITSRSGDVAISYNLYGWSESQNCHVLFCVEQATPLIRQEPPQNLLAEYRYGELSVSFDVIEMLPHVETSYIGEPNGTSGSVQLTKDEWATYAEVLPELTPNVDHLLGYSQDAQPYALEASYQAFRSKLFPELPDWNDLSVQAQQDEYHACCLLLQVEAHQNKMYFGRDGSLYFFIRNADLAQADFSRVWAWVQ